MVVDKNKQAIWALLLSLLTLTTTFQQQLAVYKLVVTPNDFVPLKVAEHSIAGGQR